MGTREVQLTVQVSPARVAAWVSVVAAIGAGAVFVHNAITSHDQTATNTSVIEELAEQEVIQDRLWGDGYEAKIHNLLRHADEILDRSSEEAHAAERG